MANSRSARKRIRANERKHIRNRGVRSSVRTYVGKARQSLLSLEPGDTVDVEAQLRAAVRALLNYSKLIKCQPVIFDIRPVNQPSNIIFDCAICLHILHGHAIHHQPVQPAIFFYERRDFNSHHLTHNVINTIDG